MPIAFDLGNKNIQITAPDTLATIQDIGNAIRLYEDDFEMMSNPKILDWFGKQDLGSGKLVGITMVLLDGWRIKADDLAGPGVTLVTVTGGNLVADTGDPVEGSTYVAYVIEQDASAAIINLTTLESNLVTAIDHQAGNREIDFTGDDALGWQEVVYDEETGLVEVARYNLFDANGDRITDTASSFVAAGKMIAARTRVP